MKMRAMRMTISKLLLGLLVVACGPDEGPPASPVPPDVHAAWHVPADLPTIQAALDTASDGDTVFLSPGIYEGDGNRDLVLRRKAVALIGLSGPDSCVIDAGGPESPDRWCLHVDSSGPGELLLRGLTLRNASTPPLGRYGGLRVVAGRVRMERCRVERNNGGGIALVQASRASLRDCVVYENEVLVPLGPGGGIFVGGRSELYMVDCVVSRNYGSDAGGIHAVGGLVRLENVRVSENSCEEYAGGMRLAGTSAYCYRCVFSDNAAAEGDGGGICAQASDLTLRECTIAGNYGGGVYPLEGSQIVAERSMLWGNCGYDCWLEGGSTIALDSCLVDTAKIWSWTPGRITRGDGMIYDDPRYCLFQGCGRPADYRLRSDSPARLPDGLILGALKDSCP